MWMFLLPPPFSIIPFLGCLSTNVETARISEDSIIATTKQVIARDGELLVIDVKDEGKCRPWDIPIRDYLLRKKASKTDLSKPLYVRVVSRKMKGLFSGEQQNYVEAVNSSFWDRLILKYLVSQRSAVRRVSTTYTRVHRKMN